MSAEAGREGVGLSGATFLVFLVLKLTGEISWSYWWVTSPLWGPLALVASIFLISLPIIYLLQSRESQQLKDIRRKMNR